MGYVHGMAIDENEKLWIWGTNISGELGNGTMANIGTPTQIKSGTKFKEISSESHNLAIDEEGNLWAWGENDRNCFGLDGKYYGIDFVSPRELKVFN